MRDDREERSRQADAERRKTLDEALEVGLEDTFRVQTLFPSPSRRPAPATKRALSQNRAILRSRGNRPLSRIDA